MANPFSKAWRYLMALFSSKVDEYADPKVQIQQAIEEAQRQHQALTQQAAQVIGNQRQLEMRLNRQLADIEKLQVNVRQALTLADQATSAGDAAKATEYNNAAEAFAAQLVTAEQSVEDLKGLHDQALQAAGQAKKAVEQNAMMLQQKIAERTKLLSQLEQAKMQEQVSASLQSMSEMAAPGNTPSLDEVRQKIERRYANAMGAAELAQNSVQGRMLEVQQASVQMAGHSRLEQIRASMRGEALPSGGASGHGRAPPPRRRRPRRPLKSRSASSRPWGGSEAALDVQQAGGMAVAGAARNRHRRRAVRRAGAEAQLGGRSARQATAQAQVGAAAGVVLHGVLPDLGGRDGGARVLEHAGVGVVHPGADRGRRGVSRDAVRSCATAGCAASRCPRSGRGPPAGCHRGARRPGNRWPRWPHPSAGCSR